MRLLAILSLTLLVAAKAMSSEPLFNKPEGWEIFTGGGHEAWREFDAWEAYVSPADNMQVVVGLTNEWIQHEDAAGQYIDGLIEGMVSAGAVCEPALITKVREYEARRVRAKIPASEEHPAHLVDMFVVFCSSAIVNVLVYHDPESRGRFLPEDLVKRVRFPGKAVRLTERKSDAYNAGYRGAQIFMVIAVIYLLNRSLKKRTARANSPTFNGTKLR